MGPTNSVGRKKKPVMIPTWAGVAPSSTASQGMATSGIHIDRPRKSMPRK